MKRFKQYKKSILLSLIGLVPMLSQANPFYYSPLKGKSFGELQTLNVKDIGYPNGALNDTQDPGTYVRGLKEFHDDIVSGQNIKNVKLTPEQNHQAEVWSLTQNDEKRYVLLMQNRSGLYWRGSKLSPVEILGINARNPSERKRFALLYARQLQEKMAKELSWQFAASQAKAEVNKDLPLIRSFDVSPFSPYNYHAVSLKAGDKLFLLTKLNLDVRRVVSTLLADIQTNNNITLNIYFAGTPSSHGIQDWANNQSIPVSLVKKGEITINTNEGPFSRFKDEKNLPVLVLVRNGKATVIDVSRF